MIKCDAGELSRSQTAGPNFAESLGLPFKLRLIFFMLRKSLLFFIEGLYYEREFLFLSKPGEAFSH